MTTLDDLLDSAKRARSISSDAALAVKLGVTKQSLSQWRKGGVITEKHLTALIDLAHADPASAVLVLREQATTAAERHVWGALARQLGVAAVVALAAILPYRQATAGTLTDAPSMHYVKWPKWALLARGIFSDGKKRLASGFAAVRYRLTRHDLQTSPMLAA